MLNIRYAFRLVTAFLARFKGLIIIGIAIGVLVFLAVQLIIPRIVGKKVERYGVTGRYHTENLPLSILTQISDGLTSVQDDGTINPSVSESWESPDKGKTWIFHLKDTAWQNGDKLKSSDINYEFSDVEISYPDDNTIVFTLQEPFSPFPAVVSRPIFKKGLLGVGSWEVEKITLSGSFVQELIISNENMKKIYKFFPTDEQTKIAFKLGEVDIISKTINQKPFDSWSTTNVKTTIDNDQTITLFFNTKDKYLADKSLRQALNYAINKDALNGKRAYSPITSSSWAYNPQVKKYDYDVERAIDLISELPNEIKDNLEIKIVSSPTLLETAEEISKYWEAVGVKSVVQVASIIPEDFQVFLTIFETPPDPDQYSIWHSTQTTSNISKYTSPRIDKLLEDGRIELDLEKRKKIYLDFQRFLLEDSPAAFLYHPNTYEISRKGT